MSKDDKDFMVGAAGCLAAAFIGAVAIGVLVAAPLLVLRWFGIV